jgi:hypothetical protein
MVVGIYLPAGVGDLATGLADYREESCQRVIPSKIQGYTMIRDDEGP